MKGTYTVDAVFSAPGANRLALGLSLTVFDICDSSVFPSAPVLSSAAANYYVGDSDIKVGVTWAEDSISV